MTEQRPFLAVDLASWFPGTERRASARQPAQLHARYRLLGGDLAGSAEVRNLSAFGAGLVIRGGVGVCALLHLDFDGLNRPVLARVVHVTAESGGVVGCTFVRELDDATLRLFHAERLGTAAGDSRRWVRFPCNVETACFAVDAAPGEQSPARVVNISAGGMGLLLPCEFRVGTLLKLDLGGTAARAAGPLLLRVVRAGRRPAGDWFLGCEFADPLRDDEVTALMGPAGETEAP